MLKKVFIFEDVEVLEARAASERPAAKRRPVLAGLNGGRDLFIQDYRSERNTQSKRLRERNHVGLNRLFCWRRESMKREPLSGSAQAALNFVHDKQGAFLGC